MNHKLNMVVTIIKCLCHPTKFTVYITLLERFNFKNNSPSLIMHNILSVVSAIDFLHISFYLLCIPIAFLNVKLPAFSEKL